MLDSSLSFVAHSSLSQYLNNWTCN